MASDRATMRGAFIAHSGRLGKTTEGPRGGCSGLVKPTAYAVGRGKQEEACFGISFLSLQGVEDQRRTGTRLEMMALTD